MTRDERRRIDHRRRGPVRGARPLVEALEGRLLLYAATGGAWPHPVLVTYSFVPDGTNIANYGSNLFQAFNAKWSTATWEGVFQEAAAIWEQVANVNLVQVSDDGVPSGSGLYEQGDPGIGDIRIGGLPSSVMGTGTLGYTLLPPPINGSSAAGDIIMNTSQPWQINSDYDLLTVAIHEFGHALGLGESAVQAAVMYGTYTNIKQSLAADDIAGIDSIYGARQPDPYMQYYGNSSVYTAADITPWMNPLGQYNYGSFDLQSPTQTEWFKVTVPAVSTGSMVVTMQAKGMSLLSPGVVLYNSSLQYLGYAGTFNASSTTTSIRLNGVVPGQVYYIQTYGDGYAWNSDGNYGLQVNFSAIPQLPIPSPVTTTLAQPNQGGGGQNDSIGHGSKPDENWVRELEGQDRGKGGGSQSDDTTSDASLTGYIPLVPPADTSGSYVTISLTAPAGPLKPARPSLLASIFPSLN
jgi:hypothetical protein